jgi:hypothetical protein
MLHAYKSPRNAGFFFYGQQKVGAGGTAIFSAFATVDISVSFLQRPNVPIR